MQQNTNQYSHLNLGNILINISNIAYIKKEQKKINVVYICPIPCGHSLESGYHLEYSSGEKSNDIFDKIRLMLPKFVVSGDELINMDNITAIRQIGYKIILTYNALLSNSMYGHTIKYDNEELALDVYKKIASLYATPIPLNP